ncbi:unnamed protein product [Cuscuta epithymum]|uniref:Ubiquitin-like protease family profile domain-containing protein n=1 Tax=Cuscuta epithymum TaxID=186058 RepID=A0AAV0CPD0_9ASTE|nr:unnamed protein product [Cuscuta epithymum]CAH9090164.1 unnamed protein product [Cuscuta epithymum]
MPSPKKSEQSKYFPRRSPRHLPQKTEPAGCVVPLQDKGMDLEKGDVQVVEVRSRPEMKKKVAPASRKLNMQRTTRSLVDKRKEKSINMNMFSFLVDKCMGDGYTIQNDADVFGFPTKTTFNKDMCNLVINYQKVANSIIELWCKSLHEKMVDNGGEMPVQFGTSVAIHRPKKASEESMNRRSHYVADLLGVGLPGQITLLPYNAGDHWVLVAIDVEMGRMYYLDSIGGIPPEDLKIIVTQGVQMYHALKSKDRLKLNWITVKCPKQRGSLECGYFVMKYIKEIIGDVDVLKNNFSTVNEYSEDDILQVREEWISYAANLIKELQQ